MCFPLDGEGRGVFPSGWGGEGCVSLGMGGGVCSPPMRDTLCPYDCQVCNICHCDSCLFRYLHVVFLFLFFQEVTVHSSSLPLYVWCGRRRRGRGRGRGAGGDMNILCIPESVLFDIPFNF